MFPRNFNDFHNSGISTCQTSGNMRETVDLKMSQFNGTCEELYEPEPSLWLFLFYVRSVDGINFPLNFINKL